jgi:hypothetical protein
MRASHDVNAIVLQTALSLVVPALVVIAPAVLTLAAPAASAQTARPASSAAAPRPVSSAATPRPVSSVATSRPVSSAATPRPVSSAATLYALNCMGCHAPPRTRELDRGPLRGEFYHSDKGRNFFIRMPAEGRRLSATEEASLLEEVLTWKRACAAIRQDAPMVNYYGDPHAR